MARKKEPKVVEETHNWNKEAENFILENMAQKTVLKAMNVLNGLVWGDVRFVELVAKAMKDSYNQGRKETEELLKGELSDDAEEDKS